MKKILILTIIVCLSLSFSAMAENSVAINNISVDGSKMNVYFDTTGLSAEDQITIITYKAASPESEAVSENIKYIDQISKEENTSISYDLNELASGTYQVKMGGTDVSSPDFMSITIDAGMSGKTYFANNTMETFAATADSAQYVKNELGGLSVITSNSNYFAAYSTVPSINGYNVKEYGIRLNGRNYKAKVDLSGSRYAMLFKGSAFSNNSDVIAFPYIIYEKAGEEDITYFGNSFVDTLFTAQ